MEYYELVGKRLSTAVKSLHYTQQQILAKCMEHGYTINQSAISKMLSGTNIQTFQVAQVCEALGLNIGEVLSFDKTSKYK